MRGFTQTHYCADATCKGFDGFQVQWAPDTMIDPAYPLDDCCPHCRHGMLDAPLAWEEPTEGLLDELASANVITLDDLTEANRKQLFIVIQAELERQARVRRSAERAAAKRREPRAAIDYAFPPAELLPF